MERETRQLQFLNKQYAAQLKKLQREIEAKERELKQLKSCGACTCLGTRRRDQQHRVQTAEVRDLGTVGNNNARAIARNVRLEIHQPKQQSSGSNDGKSLGTTAKRPLPHSAFATTTPARRPPNGVQIGGVQAASTLAEKDRELARLHEELSQLREENFALKTEADRAVDARKKDDENAQTLRELSRQVRELESELLKLREDRRRLLSESEELRQLLSSHETNLLRCEHQLSNSNRENHELAEQVRKLNSKEKHLTSEINELQTRLLAKGASGKPPPMHRWGSDYAINRPTGNHRTTSDETDSDADQGAYRGRSKSAKRSPHNRADIEGNFSRPRSCNPYCEVCRRYRSKLVRHVDWKVGALTSPTTTVPAAPTTPAGYDSACFQSYMDSVKRKHKYHRETAADSGFTDLDSSPDHEGSYDLRRRLTAINEDLTKLSSENQRLNEELHKLKVENAVNSREKHSLNALNEQLQEELSRLRRDKFQSSVVDEINGVLSHKRKFDELTEENERLRNEIRALNSKFDMEKARYDTNTSLLNAQKVKVEKDYAVLAANVESTRKTNHYLQTQLKMAEERILDLQKSMVELKASKEATITTQTQTIIKDLRSQLSSTVEKYRTVDASRSAMEKRLDDANKIIDQMQVENSTLKSKITNMEQDLIRSDTKGEAGQVRTHELERMIQNKDREISKLKGIIRDLERDYNTFRENLGAQENHLARLERDLIAVNADKTKAERARDNLSDDYKRLQEQFQKLNSDKVTVEKELHLSFEEQDKLKRTIQRYIHEIQSYERLLAEKEKERTDLLMQFHEASAELKRAAECHCHQ